MARVAFSVTSAASAGLIGSQRDEGIDAGGAARRDQTANRGHDKKNRNRRSERERVGWRHAEELGTDEPGQGDREREADRRSDDDQPHTLT